MPDEWVVDASVAAKLFLTETGSEEARAFFSAEGVLIAPDLILVELASIAAKQVRSGAIDAAAGQSMLRRAPALFDRLFAEGPLLPRAYALASAHPISVYDGLYIALSEMRGATLVTADLKLVDKMRRAQVAGRVHALG